MNYPPQHPLPPIPPPPPPSNTPAAGAGSRRPWIIATAVASLVAVAAVVTAVAAFASGPDSGAITDAADKLKDKSAEAGATKGYQISEGVCADVDTAAVGDWAKPDGDLRESVTELSGLECRAYGKSFEDGSVSIVIATHPDAEEAGKASERRKGEIYGATWSDVDGTDWDEAQYAESRIGAPVLLVQDSNLDVAVEVTASKKKGDDFKDEAAQKVLVKLAEAAVKAVKDKGDK